MTKQPTQADFDAFDAANPTIYAMIETATFRRMGTSTKGSMVEIINSDLRWNGPHVQISNDYIAFYTRKFQQLNPALAAFFDTKPLGPRCTCRPCPVPGHPLPPDEDDDEA